MSRRFRAWVLVPGALCLLPALLRGDADPAGDDIARASSLLDAFERSVARYETYFAEKVVPLLDATAAPAGAREAVPNARKKLLDLRKSYEEGTAAYAARKMNLDNVLQRCKWVSLEALKSSFDLSLGVAGPEVQARSQAHRRRSREMRGEHDARKAQIDAGHAKDAASRTAATAALLAEYETKEQAEIDRCRREYREIIDRLLPERAELCGAMWRLMDFHEKRGRPGVASEIRAEIYVTFEADLRGRGVRFHERMFGYWSAKVSALDYFLNFPGSPDYFQVYPNWIKSPPEPWNMDDVFAAVPVETLRAFDDPPALRFDGPALEVMCRTLSARLLALQQVEQRLPPLYDALREANARAGRLAALESTESLRVTMEQVINQRQHHEVLKQQSEAAGKALRTAELDVADANDSMELAREGVRVFRNGKLAQVGDPNSERALDRIARLERDLENARRDAEDPGTPALQRKNTKEVLIPRLNDELAGIRAVVEKAVANEVKALDATRQKLDRARKAAEAAPDPGSVAEIEREWARLGTMYEAVTRDAAARLPVKPAPFPPEPVGEPANVCCDTLRSIDIALPAARADARSTMLECAGNLRQVDHDVRALSLSVARLRSSAVPLAETTLQSLGATGSDEVIERLHQLAKAAEETKSFFEEYDKRLEKFGKILDRITKDAKAKGLLERTREHVDLFKSTFEHVGGYGQKALKLKEIHDQLGDDRTALQGIGGILDLAKDASGMVPLAGPLVGQALGFYADTARAAGEAALKIQSSLIEQDIAVHFSSPPAERHLYVEADLLALRTGNENARARALQMLQVRRLIALIGDGDPRDAPFK